MDSRNDKGSIGLRTRLIAFVLMVALGFAMGWLTGRSSTPTDPDATAAEQQAAQGDGQGAGPDASAPDAQADVSASEDAGAGSSSTTRGPTVEEDGWYSTRDEVALYIHSYGRLPGNFISKTKARERGWVASEGNLDEVCPGMSIGGSVFYNDDGLLPDAPGRRWTECDINYQGGFRGAERIVFSNDGLIFYTADHYASFEQLY